MNPNPLESLYIELGRPAWFWPVVVVIIFALWVGVSSLEVPQ